MKYMTIQVLLSMFLVGASGCSNSVEIIAHRGASYLAPENTMAAVKLGWEKEADVEVDIFLTKDNRIVAIHDKTTKRTAGIELEVAETTSQELLQLDVGSYKSEKYKGEPIPLLSDIVDSIPPGRKLYIEIKCGKEVLPYLQELLAESGKMSQVVIIGFNLDTVTKSKKLIDVPTYWLKGTDKNKATDEWIPHDPQLIQTAKSYGLDGMDVHYAGVTKEFVDAATAEGQKLYVWTVNDPKEAARLVDLGVTGITTDRPAWLREQLNNHRSMGK